MSRSLPFCGADAPPALPVWRDGGFSPCVLAPASAALLLLYAAADGVLLCRTWRHDAATYVLTARMGAALERLRLATRGCVVVMILLAAGDLLGRYGIARLYPYVSLSCVLHAVAWAAILPLLRKRELWLTRTSRRARLARVATVLGWRMILTPATPALAARAGAGLRSAHAVLGMCGVSLFTLLLEVISAGSPEWFD